MSKPIYVENVVIHEAPTPGMPVEYVLHLSDGNRTDVQIGTRDSQEAIVQAIANAVVDANHKQRTETLSKGLVEVLIRIRQAVGRKDLNSIHLMRDLNLSKSEYNNAQKLRYHGLIVPDHDAGAGYWLLTSRAGKFLRGEEAIPQSVTVRTSHPIDHSEILVYIDDVLEREGPRFDDKSAYRVEPFRPVEVTQVGLPI